MDNSTALNEFEAWLHAIREKNKTVVGQLMSLHDWEQGLKRAKKKFKEKNR